MGLFSTYRQGENRVTASLTAVLRMVSLPILNAFLTQICGDEADVGVSITDQVSDSSDTVPDAVIAANFRIVIETKLYGDAFNVKQMNGHLSALKKASVGYKHLVFLAPPAKSIGSEVIYEFDQWKAKLPADDDAGLHITGLTFESLRDIFQDFLEGNICALNNVEELLLGELVIMLEEEGLVGDPEDTVIVAASRSYEANKQHGIYIRQAHRKLKQVPYMMFYARGEIRPEVFEIIRQTSGNSLLTDRRKLAEQNKELSVKLEKFLSDIDEDDEEFYDSPFQLFQLKKIDTISQVENDKADKNGRPTAFTMSHRYAELEALKKANVTSELEP